MRYYACKNQYLATLTVEVEITPFKSTGKVTAVDANVDHFDYTDGVYTLRPKELNQLYGKVRHYNRVLSRKRKKCGINSKSYQKTRAKLQMTYSKIGHIQNDLLHKFTTRLYQNYDVIVIRICLLRKCRCLRKLKGYIARYLEDSVNSWSIKRRSSKSD